MDNHWAVTTSSGRRVSLLCEEKTDYSMSYMSAQSSPTPPPSPDYCRPYAPLRTDSISSACSSTSSLSTISSHGLYSPRTPPSLAPLPALERMLPLSEPAPSFYPSKLSTEIAPPVIAPALMEEGLSPTSSHGATTSTPSSPKTTAANAAIKRSSRRYSCQCGKSFTTSGHLARHTRIHTGEKNYVCPEEGCGARFSRQDNCMQHFRTHQSGAGGKRTARKRRMSTDSTASQQASSSSESAPLKSRTGDATPQHPSPLHSYSVLHPSVYPYPTYSVEPYGSDAGLAALASVACSSYT